MTIVRWALPVWLSGIVLVFTAVAASAAEVPCPPKRYACWQVRWAVSFVGEAAVLDKAKKCGWSDAKIAEARKCLK